MEEKKKKKKVIKQVKAGDLIEVPDIEIQTISYNKAKKLRPKIERTEKQKANDERLRILQKERFKKPEPEPEPKPEPIKKTKFLKVLPKRINKKKKLKVVKEVDKKTEDDKKTEETTEETTKGDETTEETDDEIIQLKKRVKKISLKKELYDKIGSIKNEVSTNQYNNIMNRMFRR